MVNRVLITNDTFHDKDYFDTFYSWGEYKFFAVNSGSSTLIPFYKEHLSQVLGDRVQETFKDYVLSQIETTAIKELFKILLEEKLGQWVRPKVPTTEVEILGKVYLLDLRLTSPDDRIINDYNKIYTIACECLEENKPMYLSIE